MVRKVGHGALLFRADTARYGQEQCGSLHTAANSRKARPSVEMTGGQSQTMFALTEEEGFYVVPGVDAAVADYVDVSWSGVEDALRVEGVRF